MSSDALSNQSPADLSDAIGQLHALGGAVLHQMLLAIAAYDASEAWRGDGACSMAAWVSYALGVSSTTGSDYVRVGRALAHLPRVSSALQEGRLCYEQVRALVRVATADTEAALVAEAAGRTATQVEGMVRALKDVSTEEAAQANQERSLRLRWRTEDRSLRLSGRLPDVDGAVVASAIERLAERSLTAPDDPEREPWDARCADALVELASCSLGADAAGTDMEISAEDGARADMEISAEDGARADVDDRAEESARAGVDGPAGRDAEAGADAPGEREAETGGAAHEWSGHGGQRNAGASVQEGPDVETLGRPGGKRSVESGLQEQDEAGVPAPLDRHAGPPPDGSESGVRASDALSGGVRASSGEAAVEPCAKAGLGPWGGPSFTLGPPIPRRRARSNDLATPSSGDEPDADADIGAGCERRTEPGGDGHDTPCVAPAQRGVGSGRASATMEVGPGMATVQPGMGPGKVPIEPVQPRMEPGMAPTEPGMDPGDERGTAEAWTGSAAGASPALANPRSRPGTARTPTDAGRPLVVVHVEAGALVRDGEGAAVLECGAPLAPETVRRLGCDGWVQAVVEGQGGRPLGVGRRRRTVPSGLLRVLRHRDGGCRFPGCTRTRWVHAHHVRHWADGGPTDLGNLLLLCGGHHRFVHEGGWRIEGDPEGGDLRFVDPDGRVLQVGPPGLRPEVAERFGVGTGVPTWAHHEIPNDATADGMTPRIAGPGGRSSGGRSSCRSDSALAQDG